MTDRVWLPLQGEHGERPKAPAVAGWQSPGFTGVDAPRDDDTSAWFGLRCDGLVVVDCDNAAAAKRWRKIAPAVDTYVRKTPRGFHFIYRQTDDSPDGPAVDVFGNGSGIDIRAGRTSQIVFHAPGYEDVQGSLDDVTLFRKVWLPEQKQLLEDAEEWSEMPDGRGNNTLAAVGGALRRQGMSMEMIYATLMGINKLTMTRDPMSAEEVRQIAMSVSRYTPDPDIDIVAEDDDIEIEGEEHTPSDQTDKLYMDARYMQLPPPPEWHWRPYLPKNRLVMLDGQEGIGKGMFCVWAAVNVASGAAFPGEDHTATPHPVVWFTAEDDPHEDILRRLYAAGYDPAAHAPIYFRNPREARLKFPADIAHLRKLAEKAKPALIIMDPGRSYLAPENENSEMSFNNEAALRPGLEQLMYMAHEAKATTIFVHHWNKSSEGTTRTKMGGSGSFLQVVRHRLTLAEVADQSALSVEKSNITDKAHTVRSFSVEEVVEFETAKFKLGGALPAYRGLDEWIDTMSKLAAEGGPEIQVVIDWEEAAWHYSYLTEGRDLAPTPENIAKDLDVSLEEARAIRAQLRDKGVIDKANRWYGQPATNRKRQLDAIEHDGRATTSDD